jgi:hypothetical protein
MTIDVRRRALVLFVAVLVLGACFKPAISLAAPLLSWSAPVQIDNQATVSGVILAGLSCPTSGLCVAVDNNGNVLTSTDPTGGASTWTKTNVDAGGGAGKGVFCLSASFCVVVDGGDVVTSTNPTGGSTAWTVSTIGSEYVGTSSIACASVSLCVAGDAFGDLSASTNPTGGASAWHIVMRATESDDFSSIACPSEALCMAADGFSGFATSTTPASSMTWHFTGQLNGGTAAVSCPSVSLCVGVGRGKIATSTNPTGGASAWTLSTIDGTNSLEGVSCPSTSMCVAVDESGNVLTSTNPTGGASAWTAANVDGTNSLTAVSCPSEALCIAVDSKGNVLVGTPAVAEEHPGGGSASNSGGSGSSQNSSGSTGSGASSGSNTPGISSAQVATLLGQQLTPSGKTTKIGVLLKNGELTMTFKAPEAGTLIVQWYELPSGAKLAKHSKAKAVLVASGQMTFSAASTVKIKVKLTAAGRKLLKHAKQVRLTAKGVFTTAGKAPVSVTKTVLLRR